MKKKLKITIVCDNQIDESREEEGFIAVHGLSILIEGKQTTLFDTGQEKALLHNLNLLGIDPDKIDRVILSHGHYDHTGGLYDLLESRDNPLKIYLNGEAFNKKIALEDNGNHIREIGFQYSRKEYESIGAEFIEINNFTKIDDEISAISNIKRENNWKSSDTRLKIKKNDQIYDDPFNDDLSLVIKTDSGSLVLLGCAHAGVVEILENINEATGYDKFHGIIGGTHLFNATDAYIDRTIASFKKYSIKLIGPSHCTGDHATNIIASAFNDNFIKANAGKIFEF